MLQTQAVNSDLLGLLKKLMEVETFNPFFLVGGTSLALQMGHRISLDLDLFGNSELDEFEFTDILTDFGSTTVLKKTKNILIYSVNGVKLDFVNYSYPWLEPASIVENIRLASKKDIAAMKLNAISGRGSKKDFIDLYFLLKEYKLSDMLGFYNRKYFQNSLFMVLKSLTYFDDADEEEDPFMINKIEWNEIKRAIEIEVKQYIRN